MFGVKLKQSISFKFLGMVTAILVVSTVVTSAMIAANENNIMKHSLTAEGQHMAFFIARLSRDPLIMKDNVQLDAIVNEANKDVEIPYIIISDARGHILTSQYASINFMRPEIRTVVKGLPREAGLTGIVAAVKKYEPVTEISTPVTMDADIIGNVTIGMSEHTIRRQIARTVLFVVALNLAAALLLAGLLFVATKRLILDPVTGLARGTALLAKGDLSIRMESKSKDELGMLVDSFNEMLVQIQRRDQELESQRKDLEMLVDKRTEQLKTINEQLQNELTEHRLMEEVLKDSEQKVQTLANTALDAIIMLDNDGNISYWNLAAERIFGFSEREAMGRDMHSLIAPERFRDAFRAGFTKFKVAGQGPVVGKTIELAAMRKDGTEFPVEVSLAAVKLKDRWNAIGILRDITDRKRMDEELRKLNEELEKKVEERTGQLLEAQDELVRKEKLATLGQVAGSVGHELRNPLGVINNAVYFLKTVMTDADETTREYLDIIKQEVSAAERIVSDLLDSVRTKPPCPVRTDVKELVSACMRKCRITDGIDVRLEMPDALPRVEVDPLQMSQVFINLIDNAVAAMPDGGTLNIRADEDGEGRELRVRVSDTGVGIAPENMGKLFQPLFTTKPRGIGLGLAVVKNLTGANGGGIEVESRPGEGATFTVTLPAGKGEA